jgi:hypothetical protein
MPRKDRLSEENGKRRTLIIDVLPGSIVPEGTPKEDLKAYFLNSTERMQQRLDILSRLALTRGYQTVNLAHYVKHHVRCLRIEVAICREAGAALIEDI